MKLPNSRRLDSQVKRELLLDRSLYWKLKHLSNEEIAAKLYEEGLGVEKEGELTKPYSGKYVGSVIREALKAVAAERSDYGKSMAVAIEAELDELLEFWRPKALDENSPSIKAAELVRKLLAQKSELLGSNAPITHQLEIKYQSDIENFINTLRQLLDEDTMEKIFSAIAKAEQLNAEFYQSQKQLQSTSDENIIDADIIS